MPDIWGFVCFDVDNNEKEKDSFLSEIKIAQMPFGIIDCSSRPKLPIGKWESDLVDTIANSHFMLVLVGRRTKFSAAIAKELLIARDEDVPYFGVYVGDADSSTPLPVDLERNRVIDLDWGAIPIVVKKMMMEGKNKK